MGLKPPQKRTDADAQLLAHLERQRHDFAEAIGLARAVASGVAPLQRCAAGLHGPVEGHINRLKRLKRQMFGRATRDLLRRRFLRAA